MKKRQATIQRVTRETRIAVTLNLDGVGKAAVRTGVPFFDHMLTLVAKHATMDLKLRCQGDLEVDAHHTVEDCGLVLGQAFLRLYGHRRIVDLRATRRAVCRQSEECAMLTMKHFAALAVLIMGSSLPAQAQEQKPENSKDRSQEQQKDRYVPRLNTLIGSPAMIWRVKMKAAMSGRPQGP